MKHTLSLFLLLLLPGLVGSQPFDPDDPYFDPFTYSGEDSPGQWHLYNQAPLDSLNAGLDVNIFGAWNNGWTGSGVTIAIVDDGTQGNHPDLSPGFLNDYSWGFGKTQATNLAESYRGSPVLPGLANAGDNHGTAVAGVAGARGDNGIGVTGAAPLANIAALRFLGAVDPNGRSDNEIQAAAILYQGQTDVGGNPDPFATHDWSTTPVRVKNHSYGPDPGYQIYEDFQMVIDALDTSASNGVLHVFAAGNQRTDWSTADSNKIFELVLPQTIAVTALGSDGTFSVYSSYGANTFVTAPSSDFPGFGITTTDRIGSSDGYNKDPSDPDPSLDFADGYNYTNKFGGTSSASPLVAGIMALGVQANPNMDVRMAKHLMVQTNRKVDPTDSSATGGWITNAAGNEFNNNYGFGLIDAGAFTEEATQYTGVTEQTTAETGEIQVNKDFATEGASIEEDFNVTVAPGDEQPLEHVIVELTISGLETDWATYSSNIGTIMGDISGWLTSPSGTTNELFFDDRHIPIGDWETHRDYHSDTLEWQFLSNAYWGETASGLWTLEIINNTDNPLSGTWQDFSFTAAMGELIAVPEPASFGFLLALAMIPVVLRRRQRER